MSTMIDVDVQTWRSTSLAIKRSGRDFQRDPVI